jgi:hypothetical protein
MFRAPPKPAAVDRWTWDRIRRLFHIVEGLRQAMFLKRLYVIDQPAGAGIILNGDKDCLAAKRATTSLDRRDPAP